MCLLQEIDEYITQAKDRSYDTMMRFGRRGLNIAATAAVTAATKVKSLCCCACFIVVVGQESTIYIQIKCIIVLNYPFHFNEMY